MECSICGAGIGRDVAECASCGAPRGDGAAAGERSACALCGGVLWSLSETCVHCEAKGYPALRPRLGDKSLGSPEKEAGA